MKIQRIMIDSKDSECFKENLTDEQIEQLRSNLEKLMKRYLKKEVKILFVKIEK